MEDIKAGEYVRDKCGEIHKVYKIDKDTIYCDKPEIENPPFDTYACRYYSNSADIVKHSTNIIDLIEVGEYVNGYLIIDIDKNNQMICLLMPFNEENQSNSNIVWFTKYAIKSILTKEMMKSVEYRIN